MTISVFRTRPTRLAALGAAAVTVLGVLTGCGDDGDGGESTATTEATSASVADALAGHSFAADEVTGHDLVEGTTVRVSFEDDVMAVSAGCNNLSGAYVTDGDVLRWEAEPARTMMGCTDGLAEQDDWLAGLFIDGVTVEDSTEDELVLVSDDVRVEMTRTDAEGDAPAAIPPSDQDYSALINGPTTGEPGEPLFYTLTNTGRRGDTYGITLVPADSGVVAPRNLQIRAGRTAKFRVEVTETPVIIKVESLGAGGFVDAFPIN